MRNLLSFFILLAVVMWSIPAKAQDAATELKKISEWYLARESFETGFDYILFTDAGMKKQVEKQQGMYCRSGNSSYMKGLATETVENSRYSVTINHQEKMILASVATSTEKTNTMDQLRLLKQYMANAGSLSYQKINKNTSEITLTCDGGSYASVKVVYNHHTYILSELHLLFRDTKGINWTYGSKQPYLVIRYYGLKYDHKISNTLFDEKKFITVVKESGKVKPAPAFSRYQLFSTIN